MQYAVLLSWLEEYESQIVVEVDDEEILDEEDLAELAIEQLSQELESAGRQLARVQVEEIEPVEEDMDWGHD